MATHAIAAALLSDFGGHRVLVGDFPAMRGRGAAYSPTKFTRRAAAARQDVCMYVRKDRRLYVRLYI